MVVTDLSGSIGTTADRLTYGNPRRRWLGIHNTSAGTITLGFTFPVSSTRGIVALAAGGYYEINTINYWPGDIYLIGSGAGLTFICQEVSN